MHANTFAGRMGRWSAQHRKKAIWGWIAFVVIAFVVGNAVGTKAPSHQDYVGQSGQAEKLFADHFAKKDGEQVMVQARKGGRAVLVQFDLKGDGAKTDERVKPTITAVDKVKDANPNVFVGQFGGAS